MIYELRKYTVNPGKMPALQARFRDITKPALEQHGIKPVGFWVNSIGGPSNELVYMLGFEDLGHRERALASLRSDKEWLAAMAETERDGPLMHHWENRVLTPTDFSPRLGREDPVIYELRIYHANPGKMQALLARFRDHTCQYFEKHGITSVGYWTHTIGGFNDELWYMVAFDDLAHRERAWDQLRADPDFMQGMIDSDRDGPLLHHFENRIMTPTDFSPLA